MFNVAKMGIDAWIAVGVKGKSEFEYDGCFGYDEWHTNSYMYFPKDRKMKMAIMAGALVVVLGGVCALAVRGSGSTSQPFLIARKNAAEVSQHIVNLTVQTGEKLAAANAADISGGAARAEALIEEARAANGEAYHDAGVLASYLKDLASSLASLNSPARQAVAYEAVAIDLSLVSEFIVYTQNLNDFFDKISRAIETGRRADKNDAAAALAVVNEGAKKINALNADFQTRMRAFDAAR